MGKCGKCGLAMQSIAKEFFNCNYLQELRNDEKKKHQHSLGHIIIE